MPNVLYDLNPVTHITIDTTGSPGRRTFYLQASQRGTVVSLIVEKEQAAALANGIQGFLEELGNQHPEWHTEGGIMDVDLALREPVIPEFRVGQFGVAYDEANDLMIIVAQELAEEGEEDLAAVAHFWATRHQMRSLSEHALEVVGAGRPICPQCGQPIDPEGHHCPRRDGDNGYH